MGSSLILGKYIIGKASGRDAATVVEDGAVFQRDGTIVDVGPAAELTRRHRADRVLGSSDHVVLPGFVNSHHHVGLTPFQLGSPDYPLELWFASRMAARDVDPYLDTLYSAFEMLESGITTVQHLHGWRIAPAARVIGVAERILKAYEDIGMRVSYSAGSMKARASPSTGRARAARARPSTRHGQRDTGPGCAIPGPVPHSATSSPWRRGRCPAGRGSR